MVASWSAIYFVVAAVKPGGLLEGASLVLGLPLARAQASVLFGWSTRTARGELLSAAWSGSRELVHKVLWAVCYFADQAAVLGRSSLDAWASAPIPFALQAAVVLVVVAAAFSMRASRRAGLRYGPTSIWLEVQLSAAVEEVLYRGLATFACFRLVGGDTTWAGEEGLATALAVGLFALPHYRLGSPGGARGVAVTAGLGIACFGLSWACGDVLAGWALHGPVLGSLEFRRWWAARRAQLRSVARDRVLQLVRLGHAYYVTDWEGVELQRLCAADSALARGLDELIARHEQGVAIDAQACAGASMLVPGEAAEPGMARWRSTNALLAAQLPPGRLPGVGFSQVARETSKHLVAAMDAHRARVLPAAGA
ncbi:hypothetical protein [Engelhardtia mirabilis]|uniref:hypothetical protein n=1 Tax=Engelhardtia mirabilis TaxID=2528011 RepID=UPI0011A1C1E1